MDKLAYKVEEAEGRTGLCRATLFKAIKEGKLIARKHGRSTLILHDDLQVFLKNLPKRIAEAPETPPKPSKRRNAEASETQEAGNDRAA